MSISRTELSSAVIGKLELNASDSALLSKFQVYENLTEAQLELLNRLSIKHLRDGLKTVKFNLELGYADYQWPTDFIRYVEMHVDYTTAITQSNPGKKVLEFDSDLVDAQPVDIATTSFPILDLNVQDGFMIYPIPTAAVTKGGRLRYIYKVPDITAAQDSALNPNLKNLLIFKATSLSALVDQYRPDLAVKYDEMYEKAIIPLLPKQEPDK